MYVYMTWIGLFPSRRGGLISGFVLYFPDGRRWGLGGWFKSAFLVSASSGAAWFVSAMAGELI